MVVKVVVAATNANGEPDFYWCKVDCSDQEYNEGWHYAMARDAAEENGYEGEMVVFDEHDPPKPLFNMFNWESASTFKSQWQA